MALKVYLRGAGGQEEAEIKGEAGGQEVAEGLGVAGGLEGSA